MPSQSMGTIFNVFIAIESKNSSTAVAGYVRQRFASTINCIELKWLPFEERIAFNSAKLASKAIHEKTWPKYLQVQMKTPGRILRSYENNLHSIEPDSHFAMIVSKHYNALPLNLRRERICLSDYKKYFLDLALSRTMS